MTENRKYKLTIARPDRGHYLPGDSVALSITAFKQDGNALRSLTTNTKHVKVSSSSFKDGPVEFEFKRNQEKRVILTAVTPIKVKLESFDGSTNSENYTFWWDDGFDPKGQAPGIGNECQAEKTTQLPWAELSHEAPTARKPFTINGQIKASVTIEDKLAAPARIKFSGPALKGTPEVSFPGGRTRQTFVLDLSDQVNIASDEAHGFLPHFKIESMERHSLEPGTGKTVEQTLDFKTWKLELDSGFGTGGIKNITQENNGDRFFRGDKIQVRVKIRGDKAAPENLKFEIQLIHADNPRQIQHTPPPFTIGKGQTAVEVEFDLKLDHVRFPTQKQAETETLLLRVITPRSGNKHLIEAADGSHLTTKEIHAEKNDIEIGRYEIKLEENPVNTNQDHGRLFFLNDNAEFSITLPATCSKAIRGHLQVYRPAQRPEALLKPTAEFTIPVGRKASETVKVEYPLALASNKTAPTRDETFTVKIEVENENYAYLQQAKERISNFRISMLPVVTFDSEEPVKGRTAITEQTQSLFKLGTGSDHTVKLKRNAVLKDVFTPRVNLQSPALAGGDVAVSFRVGELTAEATVRLQNEAAVTTLSIKPVSDCIVPEIGRALNLKTVPPHLYVDDDWLTPKGLPAAPGDQIWIKLNRDAPPLVGEEVTAATIECEAFAENPANSARKYDVVFKQQDPARSQYVSVEPAAPLKGIRMDPAVDLTGGTGDTKEFELTVTPDPLAGLDFPGIHPKIVVSQRCVCFSRRNDVQRLEEDIVSGIKKHPVHINLTHPARTHTIVVVKSNYAQNGYKLSFAPAQDHLTFEMTFDVDPVPPENLELTVEPFAGNLTTSSDTDRFPVKIPKLPPPVFVAFDRLAPIVENRLVVGDSRASVRRTGSQNLPTFSIGDKAEINIVLSRRAPIETTIALACDAFYDIDQTGSMKRDPVPAYEVTIPAGATTVKAVVEFKYRFREYEEIRLLSEYEKTGSSGSVRSALTRNPDAYQPIAIRLKTLPILRFGKVDEPDGTKWIDPPGIPFMPADTAEIFISLSAPNSAPEPINGTLDCPVLKESYPFSINTGAKTPAGKYPINVVFKERGAWFSQNWGSLPISIELSDRRSRNACKRYDAAVASLEIIEKREVMFPVTGALSSNGPFVPDDRADIKICLNHPAPVGAAKATLQGPFDIIGPRAGRTEATVAGSVVTIPARSDFALIEVNFNAESGSEQTIRLSAPEHCTLHAERKELKVLVKKPEVTFDTDQWGTKENWQREELDQKACIPGRSVRMPFILKQHPCPEGGCTIKISSAAFKGGSDTKYELVFAEDQNKYAKNGVFKGNQTYANILIKSDYVPPDPIVVEIAFEDPERCAAPSGPASVTFAQPPEIVFTQTDYPTLYEVGVSGKDEAILKIKPKRKPANNLQVRLQSAAFGANVYVVTLPKDTEDEVSQKVSFTVGKTPELAAENPYDIVLAPPTGWAGGNPHIVQVKVKTPPGNQPVSECSRSESESRREQVRFGRQGVILRDSSYPDQPCNLRHLLLTVNHGNTTADDPLERGPFDDGTFEIVRHPNAAKDKNKALICSRYTAPIIQVTGGRPEGESKVTDYRRSALWSTLKIGLDPEEKYCGAQYTLSSTPYIHPFIFVAERSLDATTYFRRQPLTDTSHSGLLAPAGPRAMSIYRRRVDERQRYSWAPLYPEVEPDYNIPATVAEFDLLCAHQLIDTDLVKEPPDSRGSRFYNAVSSAFALLRHLFVGRTDVIPQQYLIEAQCCALPDTEKPYGPAENLRAIVEVFPSDEYCFYIGGASDSTVVEHLDEGKFIGPTQEHTRYGEKTVRSEFDPSAGFNIQDAIKSAEEIQADEKGQLTRGVYPFERQESDPTLGPQDETPDELGQRRLNISIESVGDLKCTVKVILETVLNADAVIRFSGAKLSPATQPKTVVRELAEQQFELILVDNELGGAKLKMEPFLGHVTDSGEAELALQAGQTTWRDMEPAPPESETAPNDESLPPEKRAFKTLLINPKNREDHDFVVRPDQPPSKVLFEIDVPDAKVDLEYQGTEINKPIWEPDDQKENDPANESWDKALNTGFLKKLADIHIHLGRNGKVNDPKANHYLREALLVLLDALTTILRFTNGGSPEMAYGFGFSFSLGFLQGHYVRYWGYKECRDNRVFWWNANNIDMMVISLNLEILFGFALGFCGLKLEAVIFGGLTGRLDIHRSFEKNEPDAPEAQEVYEWGKNRSKTKKTEAGYVEKWVDTAFIAQLGARIVIGKPCYFQLMAAIETGYTLRWRTTTEYGVDLEVYWQGLTVKAVITIKCICNKEFTKVLIKGNVAGWPQASLTLGGKGERRMLYVNKSIAQGLNRIEFTRNRFVGHLHKYQELQVLMVADKKIDDGTRYPFTAVVPHLGYEADGPFESPSAWEKNKVDWDRQWTLCKQAFAEETQTVQRRHWWLSKEPLKDRLQSKQARIERLVDGVIAHRLRALDALDEKYTRLQEQVKAVLERSGDVVDASESESLLYAAERLKNDPAIDYRHMKKQELRDFGNLVEGLHYYALMRQKW